jgi:hypothetical protein
MLFSPCLLIGCAVAGFDVAIADDLVQLSVPTAVRPLVGYGSFTISSKNWKSQAPFNDHYQAFTASLHCLIHYMQIREIRGYLNHCYHASPVNTTTPHSYARKCWLLAIDYKVSISSQLGVKQK